MEFDWDDGNADHILYDHDVIPNEAMEIFYNKPVALLRHQVRHQVGKELRHRIVGITNSQRVLTVVFILRKGKIRIVTAFNAATHEIKIFLKRRN